MNQAMSSVTRAAARTAGGPPGPSLAGLRQALPAPVKRPLRPAKRAYHALTSGARGLPDLLIIGAQKCGTTSLYTYLGYHPMIAQAATKEVHYFDINYHKGLSWYRAHFPLQRRLAEMGRRFGVDPIVVEASPYYLAHPLAPYRVKGLMPNARLIVLLRDPVERAISHYGHAVADGSESLPFAEAVEREEERLDGEAASIVTVPLHRSFNHQHFSYLARGRYAEQLEVWFSLFERKQFLILDSARFFADPGCTLDRVYEFLGLPHHEGEVYAAIGARKHPDIDPALKQRLRSYFASHNERLWRVIGDDFGWEDEPA
jgi:hypothetical protein